MDPQICCIINTTSNTPQPARFSSPSSIWKGITGVRDLALPRFERKQHETNTELKPATEGGILFLEQLLQHRDLRHLSFIQKTRRADLIAAVVEFNRKFTYATTFSTQLSEIFQPYALIGHLVIRTASSHQRAEIFQSGFEAILENNALRTWAIEHGLNDQEIDMLRHPESISEPGHSPQGMSAAFDDLRKASHARHSEVSSNWLTNSENDFEEGAYTATSAPDSRPEPNETNSDSFGLLRNIPVGERLGLPRQRHS